MQTADLQAYITRTKAQLEKLDANMAALTDVTIRNYAFDTGQSRQSARRHDLAELVAARDLLASQLCVAETRLRGSGTHRGVAAW